MVFRVSVLILKLKKQEIFNKDSENVKGCSGNMTSLHFPILFLVYPQTHTHIHTHKRAEHVFCMCSVCLCLDGNSFPCCGFFIWIHVETLHRNTERLFERCFTAALWSMSIMSHQTLYQHLMSQIKLQRKLMPSSWFENAKMPQILKCCLQQWSVAWQQSRVRSRHKKYQVVRVRKRLGIKYLWKRTWCLVKNIQ